MVASARREYGPTCEVFGGCPKGRREGGRYPGPLADCVVDAIDASDAMGHLNRGADLPGKAHDEAIEYSEISRSGLCVATYPVPVVIRYPDARSFRVDGATAQRCPAMDRA